MSHAQIGWEIFTDAVIKKVSEQKEHVIFVLWGKFAQQKSALIDDRKHTILKAAHPSPFSAYNGFFGCRHFSKINELLAVPIRF
jgi:uracil-DNA glycosylase